MKIIEAVAAHQRIEFNEDTTIDGSVGMSAIIVINGGSLTVKGDIAPCASIRVTSTQKTQSTSSPYHYGVSMSGDKTTFFGAGSAMQEILSARTIQWGKRCFYMGDVRVKGRIFNSDGKLEKCSEDCYEITPENFAPKPGETVQATVDGIKYEGEKIKITGHRVWVNDIEMLTPPLLSEPSSSETIALPAGAVRVTGMITTRVKITADENIEVKDIGARCQLKSVHSSVHAGNVGDDVDIRAHGEIQIENAGFDCYLSSDNSSIKTNNLNAGAQLHANNVARVNDIGDNCLITCKGDVHVSNIGSGSTINSDRGIYISGCSHIDETITLKSKLQSITFITPNQAESTTTPDPEEPTSSSLFQY